MKTKILMVLLFIILKSNGQNENQHSTFFCLTPLTKKMNTKVNGLAFGLGLDLFLKQNSIKKVNGINIEINPLFPLVLVIADPSRNGFAEDKTIKVNGISIGTGNAAIDQSIAHTGIQVSLFNAGYSCNGVSLNLIYEYETKQNGLNIAGLSSVTKNSNGITISLLNESERFNGLQIGAYNETIHFNGLQIGLLNKSKTQHGLQIGLWNINTKRSFPFLNW